jgi:hypothetical protein
MYELIGTWFLERENVEKIITVHDTISINCEPTNSTTGT